MNYKGFNALSALSKYLRIGGVEVNTSLNLCIAEMKATFSHEYNARKCLFEFIYNKTRTNTSKQQCSSNSTVLHVQWIKT